MVLAERDASASAEPAPADPGLRRAPVLHRPAIVWLSVFLALFAVLAAWSLASPPYSGPDEPAHVVQAAALAHGELLGRPVGGADSPSTSVVVPAYLGHANAIPSCFNGRDQIPASCERALPSGTGSITEVTYVGRYPPLYGFITGWPTLVSRGPLALHLMRLSGSAVCAALLAGGAWCALRARRRIGLLIGLAAAMTPQVAFLGGVVNPSGLEISAAICLWTSGLVVAEHAREGHATADRAALAWLVASAALMANLRGLSPFLLGLIALVLVAVAGWGGLLTFLRSRAGQVAAGLVAVSVVLALVWIFGAGALRVLPSRVGLPTGLWPSFLDTARNVASMLPQYLGVFGWVDTPLPIPLYVAGLGLIAVGIGVGLGRGDARQRRLIGLAVAVSVAVPILLTLSQASRLGEFGQARDWMPLWVGVPLLACRTLGDGLGARRAARLALTVGVAAAVVQVLAWLQLLRRFRFGLGGHARATFGVWTPPVPVGLLLALLVGALAAGLAVLWAVATRRGPTSAVSTLPAPPPPHASARRR